jgi:hypothetical protein
VDGKLQTPGTSQAILSATDSTLLDKARSVLGDAQSVDVLDVFAPAYLSTATLLVTPFTWNPHLPPTLGSVDMQVSQLPWPPNMSAPLPYEHALWLLHADTENPCGWDQATQYSDNCFTSFGAELLQVFRADAAASVATSGSSHPISAAAPALGVAGSGGIVMQAKDCFGNYMYPGPSTIAEFTETPYSADGNGISAQYSLLVWDGSALRFVKTDRFDQPMSVWLGWAVAGQSPARLTNTFPGLNLCTRASG